MTALQTLRHGLRGLGVRVTSGRGWVTISTIDGAWSETFDSAADALQWACAARLAHIDQCKPYPWAGQQPARNPESRG